MGNLKLNMKFAIVAALFAAVAAKCEPAKYHTTIYMDDECKKVDEDATKIYGEVPKEKYELYDPGCHWMSDYKLAYVLKCDDVGVHQSIYSDMKCSKIMSSAPRGGKITYKFDVCEKAAGADVYFIVKKDD